MIKIDRPHTHKLIKHILLSSNVMAVAEKIGENGWTAWIGVFYQPDSDGTRKGICEYGEKLSKDHAEGLFLDIKFRNLTYLV